MRFFRTSPAAYAQIQPAVDAVYWDKYIATGKCKHILPPNLEPRADGLCYIAVPEWMTESEQAQQFILHPAVEEITEEEFEAVLPTETL